MRKLWKVLVLSACTAALLAGCADKEDKKPEKPQEDQTQTQEIENQSNLDVLQPLAYGNVNGLTLEPKTNITIIGRENNSEYWMEIKKGAQRAIKDINELMGYKGNDKVTLTYAASDRANNVDDQVNILDEEMARYPAAMAISAVDATACEVQFDLAAENDIPIVAFDSGTDYKDIVSMIDTNNREAAQTAAQKLSESIDESGEIILVVHDSKSTSAMQREQSFIETIQEKYPNITIGAVYHMDRLEEAEEKIRTNEASVTEDGNIETIESDETEEEGMTQEEVLRYILEHHPDAKGIFATSETTTELVLDVLSGMKREAKVVAFDGGKNQIKRLKDGKIDGLIVQNPFGIGYATVVACARAVLDQGNEAVVNTGYTWVTKDNLKDPNIAKMMY